jgi:hypothetical protein
MLARIITPIAEANIDIGVVWMDCEFPSKPVPGDQLTFKPHGDFVTVHKAVPADPAFTPAPINIVLFTSRISFPVSNVDSAHSMQLLKQGWYRENEANYLWPTHIGLSTWLEQNLGLGTVMSWARAVTDDRRKDVCPLNYATNVNGDSHKWKVEPED